MTRNAVFEVNTLADAVARAARVAPTKGSAYDAAAGIVIDIDPGRHPEPCVMIATNLEVSLRLALNTVALGDEPMRWRLSSKLFHGLTNSMMPASSGAEIELKDTGDGFLYMKSGKMKAKLRQIVGEYPLVSKYDTTGMLTAPNLSARLAQVAWATDRGGHGALAGVHLSGEHLIGCDRANAVIVPCKVPLEEPVTAPLAEVSAIIRNTNEVAIRADEKRLMLMPDEFTQASCSLIVEPYPNVLALLEKVPAKFEAQVPSEPLLGMIDRTVVLMKEERLPSTRIELGDGYMKMTMSTDSGLVIEEMDIVGGTIGADPLVLAFNPDVLRSALIASGRPELTFRYGPEAKHPFLVSDDNEFRAVLMPMAVL